MASSFIVHFVDKVSGWVHSSIQSVEPEAEAAVKDAASKFFGPDVEIPDNIRAVPQVLTDVVKEEAAQTEAEVKAEPIPVTVPEVESEAEKAAKDLLANLPDDVKAALVKEASK